MSEFPVFYSKSAYEHKGGTKEYHLMLLRNKQDRCIMIRRWGRVGRAVNVKVDTADVRTSGYYSNADAERRHRGYLLKNRIEGEASDLQELINAITVPVWTKLGFEAVKIICPSVDVSRLKPARPPEYDEDGRRIRSDRMSSSAEELLKASLLAVEQEILEHNSRIAGFGRF